MPNNTKGELTQIEKDFITKHKGCMSIREIARKLSRGGKIIHDFMKAEGFTDCSGKKDTRRHPWRKANYQLGIYVETDAPKTYKSSGRDKR